MSVLLPAEPFRSATVVPLLVIVPWSVVTVPSWVATVLPVLIVKPLSVLAAAA